MAAVTYADLLDIRRQLMSSGRRLSVILAVPTATSDATAGVFLVHDPDPADAPNTVATEESNAKGGLAGELSWKSYSAANVRTAYGL